MNKSKKLYARALYLVFALALVAGLAGVPAAAQSIPIELGVKNADSTAGWSPAQAVGGSYSVYLASGPIENPAWPPWGDGDEARIAITMPAGTTLGDIDSIAWSVYAVAGYPPHVDIYLDVDGDGVVDDEDVLTAEMYADNNAAAPLSGLAEWAAANVNYNTTWLQTFELTSGDGFGTVNDDTRIWLSKLGGGPGDAPWSTLANWKLGFVDGDPENEIDAGIIDATAPVLRLEIEVDNWMIVSEAYVDNLVLMLNGISTTYDLEPPLPPLDKDFYKVGDEPIVTIYDVAANADPMAIDFIGDIALGTSDLHVTSTTDSIGDEVVLTETEADSGKFTGTFTLLGAPPAVREDDEIVVSEGDTITLTYPELSVTALVDDTAPTIGELLPADGAIVYDTAPDISATYLDETSGNTPSGIDTDSVVITVNGTVVTPTLLQITSVLYKPPAEAFDAGDTVEVTVDVSDKAGNAADTASWSFTIASPFNVTVTPDSYVAGNEDDLVVTITGVDASGPDGGGGNPLNWAKVAVSAPVGQSLSTGEWAGEDTGDTLGDATFESATQVKFEGLLPNDASSNITVTVTGELDDETAVGPVTLTIPVSGFIVTDITPSTFQVLDTTSDISVTVTTKAGEPVSASLVTITAELADGFEKDVTGDGDLDSFTDITINGLTGEIKYDDANAETCSVTGGFYQVTGITFAELGGVTVTVGEVENIRAKFDPAFSVWGVDVYEVLLDPDTVTAGVGTEVAVTVTENGDPVTAIDSIELDSVESLGATTSDTGEYTITVLELEAGTPAVTVTGEVGQKYGTADLTIGLPTVDYTIYETVGEEEVERNVMLTGVPYTVAVTVTDALGEALDGFLWIGTYDAEAEEFTSVADADIEPDLPIDLDADGAGEFDITPTEEASLVWMVGWVNNASAALVLEPAIAVEDLYYDVNPKQAMPDVDTTYTVTDNYLDVAGTRSVRIITPSGDVVNKVTTPAGIFKYTAPEIGAYYVSVMTDDTWQAPITIIIGEAPPPPPGKGDFDGDNDIDILDFVHFAEAYGSVVTDPNYNVIGDFDDDGQIDFFDFVQFASVYGTSW